MTTTTTTTTNPSSDDASHLARTSLRRTSLSTPYPDERKEESDVLSAVQLTFCERIVSVFVVVFISLSLVPVITSILTATVTDFAYTSELRNVEQSLVRQAGEAALKILSRQTVEPEYVLDSLGNMLNLSASLFVPFLSSEADVLDRLFDFVRTHRDSVVSGYIAFKKDDSFLGFDKVKTSSSAEAWIVAYQNASSNYFQRQVPSAFAGSFTLSSLTQFPIVSEFSRVPFQLRPWFIHGENLRNRRPRWYPFPYVWISNTVGLTVVLPYINSSTLAVDAVAALDISVSFLDTLSEKILQRLRTDGYLLVVGRDIDGNLVLLSGSRDPIDLQQMRKTLYPITSVQDPVIRALVPYISIPSDSTNEKLPSVSFFANGVEYLAVRSIFQSSTGLTLFTAAILQEFRPPIWKVALIITVIFITTSFVAYLFVSYLSARLSVLEDRMRLLSSFSFVPEAKYDQYSFFGEIRSIQRSMNHLFRSMKIFSLFVPPNVVKSIVEGHIQSGLFLKESYVSVCFLSIREFERFAEHLDAASLLRAITRCIEEFSSIVTKNGGTVDKISGHNLMYFFGEPLPFPHVERAACITAIQIMERLEVLRCDLSQFDPILSDLTVRIGINAGRVKVGNWGTNQRLSYTVLGDPVNHASRCSYITEKYAVPVIVTPVIVQAICPLEEKLIIHIGDNSSIADETTILFRRIDRQVVVKGRTEASDIFELVGFKSSLPLSILHLVELNETCFAADERSDARAVRVASEAWKEAHSSHLASSRLPPVKENGRWCSGLSPEPIHHLEKKYEVGLFDFREQNTEL